MEFHPIYQLLWSLILIMVLLNFGIQAQQYKRNYNDILKSLKYPNKLIFDITKAVNAKTSESYSDVRLNELQIQLSPTLYYRQGYERNESYTKDSLSIEPDPDYNSIETFLTKYPQAVSFLFGDESNLQRKPMNPALPPSMHSIRDLLENANSANLSFTVIFKMDLKRYHEYSDDMNDIITTLKSQWSNVKVGLEYDKPFYEHGYGKLLPTLQLSELKSVDLVIANSYMTPQNLLLTYTAFKPLLDVTMDPSQSFIRKSNMNCTIYQKINFNGSILENTSYSFKNVTEETNKNYYYYLLQFSVFLLNEGNMEGIILPTFENSLGMQEGLDGVNLKDIVTPKLRLSATGGVCKAMYLLKQVSTYFKSIVVSERELVSENVDKCFWHYNINCSSHAFDNDRVVCPPTSGIVPDIYINYDFDPDNTNLINDLTVLRTKLDGLPWKLIILKVHLNTYFPEDSHEDTSITDFAPTVDRALKELPSTVNVGCRVADNYGRNSHLNLKSIYEKCSMIWNRTLVIVLDIYIGTSLDDYRMMDFLLNLHGLLQRFSKRHPEKTIRLNVEVKGYENIDLENRHVSLYCQTHIIISNERTEAVINFARVHNISLEIKPAIDIELTKSIGWWSTLKTVEEVNLSKTQFPVFVARNYPDNSVLGSFQTDPCISWTTNVSTDTIKMDPLYTGTTLYLEDLKNNSMTFNEMLEFTLLIALHKFSLVEVVPSSISELQAVVQLLSQQKFIDRLTDKQRNETKLFLSINCHLLDQSTSEFTNFLLASFKQFALKPVGIHLVNWENSTMVYEVMGALSHFEINVGLSLEDCASQVNNYWTDLQNFRYLPEINFVVCSLAKPIEINNRDMFKMEKYLDSHLYINKFFQKTFLSNSMEIFFRLNTIPNDSPVNNLDDKGEIETFLKFYNDVSQYAIAYKLKFFMVPAIDNGHKNRSGWWKILKLGNPADSIIFEKESAYLGFQTWRPPVPALPEVESQKLSVPSMVIGGFSGAVILVIVTCGVVLLLLRMRYEKAIQILTKTEIREFLNGQFQVGSGEAQAIDNLKFPQRFAIPKSSIILSNIIGKGNFGLVYNATLTEGEETISVAVKIPRPNSPKESFKSMLSELKVLCYVGKHAHVLRFLGAYIQEIRSGTVYIVSELCEAGALQEYLRKLYQDIEDEDEGNILEMKRLLPNELIRFSFEIASGMEYIAERNIVHGDLSTRNVLLDSNLHCKIGDFGLARKLYECKEYIKKNEDEGLAWRWLAIETLRRMQFTTKTDIWSYGITLWEIFTLGGVPYGGLMWSSDFITRLEDGLRLSAPTWSSNDMYLNGKMQACWDIDPEKRPTFNALVNFFGGLQNIAVDYVQL